MIIALASPRVAPSLDAGLDQIKKFLAEAAVQGAAIVCFPEAYLPGLRGVGIDVLPFGQAEHARVLEVVAQAARTYGVAAILGTERLTAAGRQITAEVFDAQGRHQGYQSKNQIDPSEDPFYVPGDTRQIFEIDGLKFGIAICHEAWRYPETVRWASARAPKLSFNPSIREAITRVPSSRTGALPAIPTMKRP